MPAQRSPGRGFTLMEVMVGLLLLALMSLMSWRGLDGLLRSQAQLRERGQTLASLQTALAQWSLDLDQAAQSPYLNAIAWDGQQLRIVRRAVTEEALLVVSWGLRPAAAPGDAAQWRRWQSAALHDRAALFKAWNEAPARLDDLSAAVTLVPLKGWELFYHQGAGWVQAPSLGASPGTQSALVEPPAGVRLRLQLPAAAGLEGLLELDWANPSQNRGRP